jgi:hypothetical protein
MVRVSPEQFPDTVRLPVGQTESAMKRLGGDLRQVVQSNRGRGGISRELATLRSRR